MLLQKPMLGTQIDWSNPLNDGLVLDLLMNEGHGNIVNDLSGWGNHGTLHGFDFPPTRTSGWNPGMDGVALTFDGVDDYIAADSTGYDKDKGTLLVSLCAVKTGVQYIISVGNNIENEAVAFRLSSDGFQVNVNGVWRIIKYYDYTPLFNEYHLFIFTWDDISGIYKLYLDGVDVSRATTDTENLTVNGILIGKRATGNLLEGSIARARILSRTMSAFEVLRTQIDPYGVYLR